MLRFHLRLATYLSIHEPRPQRANPARREKPPSSRFGFVRPGTVFFIYACDSPTVDLYIRLPLPFGNDVASSFPAHFVFALFGLKKKRG